MPPCVQFCTDAFSEYARLTDAQLIFSTQFRYLAFFRYFWQYNVFIFTILGMTLLSIIYFSCCTCCSTDREYLRKVQEQIKADYRLNKTKTSKLMERKGGERVVEMTRPKGWFS